MTFIALITAIVGLDVRLTHFEKRSITAKYAKGIRSRLDPVRNEVLKFADADTIEPTAFNYLFEMLLNAVPAPNHHIPPDLRSDYFGELLKLKPTSLAALRHLAKARVDLGDLIAAKPLYVRLARQTRDPVFIDWEERLSLYVDRLDRLSNSLSTNESFLASSVTLEGFDSASAQVQRVSQLRFLVEYAPLSLIPYVKFHGTREDHSLFASCISMRHLLMNSRRSSLEEPQFISAFDLRNFIQDKTICLVSNSGALLESQNGAFIDGHDVVIRFNSFAINPLHTGEKTTIHCSIHLKDHNRDISVPIRLILGNAPALWAETVRKLAGAAQDFIGDDTLSYPLYAKTLCNDSMKDAAPTTGYNIIRLLHLFSNFKDAHLVCFDGYEYGSYRTSEGLAEPHATIHDSFQETEWIAANTIQLSAHVRRLVPLEYSEYC